MAAVIKCKMCGGDLNLIKGTSIAECEFCGSVQTVPRADDDKKLTLFARANRLRAACEFDKAAGIYETIVADFPEEAEAYWGLVLCKYGIEYVDDPATGKKIPTCHRSSFDSVMDDSDLDQALENADAEARTIYREEAKAIEEIRKGIIAVSSNEDPYDIFICYKETAENGERTLDSVLAQDVYDALTDKGYRVFFSRITLEDKLGMEYEPYIFAALNSARIMLAVGTSYDYYTAVWVKNEWSRFLKLIAKDKGRYLIPCYKGIDAYDMPKEFQHLQSQDLGKIGAMQDLLRGIGKLLPRQSAAPIPAPAVAPAQPVAGSADGMDRIRQLIAQGAKLQAVKELRTMYNINLKQAMQMADQIQASGNVPMPKAAPAPQPAPQPAPRPAPQPVPQPAPQPVAQPLFGVSKPAFQGMTEIAAAIREKKFSQALGLIQKCYELSDSMAQVFLRRAELCLLYDSYPFEPAVRTDSNRTELVNAFQEMRTMFMELDSAEKNCINYYNKYASKDPEYCTKQVEYYKGRIRHYVGRIQYYSDRMAKVEPATSTGGLYQKQLAAAALQCRIRTAVGAAVGFHVIRQDGVIVSYKTDHLGNNEQVYTEFNPDGAVAYGGSYSLSINANSDCRQRWSFGVEGRGMAHVILKWDGTLFSFGLVSERFQAETSQWKDIVDMGFFASSICVALTKDGRVLTASIDDKVSLAQSMIMNKMKYWENITAIAVARSFCLGLCEDGHVFCSESAGYGDVEKWENIVSISCNVRDQIVAAKADGTVVARGNEKWKPADVSAWQDVVVVRYCLDIAVGITKTGKVFHTVPANYRPAIPVQLPYRQLPNVQIFDNWENAAANVTAALERIRQQWVRRQNIDELIRFRIERLPALQSELSKAREELKNTTGLFAGKKRKELEEKIAALELQIRRSGN